MGLPGRPNIAFSTFFNFANKIGLPGLINTPLKKLRLKKNLMFYFFQHETKFQIIKELQIGKLEIQIVII